MSGDDFPTRLRQLREAHGMNQTDVVRAMNAMGFHLTRSSYSAWETGRAKPKRDNAVALADLLGVSIDLFLLDEEGESEQVRLVRGYMTKLSPEDQTTVEAMVRSLFERKIKNK